ncbi:MAG: putative metal-dependent hydrolase [bacterium]|nr:putative metal-dependent hydrolase [bacterium]
MEKPEIEKLMYPIGRFKSPESITQDDLRTYISEIESLPADLRKLVADFSEEKLNTHYRKNGWSVKQVVHHIADSHMNAFIRFKAALTEDTPTIKPYYEDKWAELGDSKNTPVDVSLNLLDALHIKWVNLLRSMNEKDFTRTFFHPEHGIECPLNEIAAMYAWHGKHHYAHINELKKRMEW